MSRFIAIVLVSAALWAAPSAAAQELGPGPGSVEVTLIPVGGMFFTKAEDVSEPGFGNYDLGVALTVNLNRFFAIEGELGGALGVTQNLQFGDVTSSLKTPHLLSYTGSLVLSAPTGSAFVPYLAGGIGGLTLSKRASLDITDRANFLVGNFGGGLKWYAGRWGLRGDYRFVPVRSNDDAPAFFGQEARYGHRVYGAVILNVR